MGSGTLKLSPGQTLRAGDLSADKARRALLLQAIKALVHTAIEEAEMSRPFRAARTMRTAVERIADLEKLEEQKP